jgi:hypothetical protein
MLIYLIDIVFPCSNIWLRTKVFLCLWHVHKAWVENVVKNIKFAKEQAKVLCALGRIMYSKGCPIDFNLVLWVEQQIDLLQCCSLHSIPQKTLVVEGKDVVCWELKHSACWARHQLLCKVIPQQHEKNFIFFKKKVH